MIVLGILYRLIDFFYAGVLLLIFGETLTIRKNRLLQILSVCLLWFMGSTPIYSRNVRNMLVVFGELIVFVVIFFSDRWMKKMLMLSFFYPFIISVNYLMTNLYERVFYGITGMNSNADWSEKIVLIDTAVWSFASIIRLLIGIGFYLYLRRYLREISEMMTDKIWKVLATILMLPIFSIFGMIYFFPEGTVFLYPICIITILTEFAFIYLAAYLCKKVAVESYARELEMRQSFYEERVKEEECVRAVYHDMKNHLLILQSQANGEKESQEMIRNLQKQISNYENYVKTGNIFLDVILRDKMKLAKEKYIDFHTEIDLSNGTFLDGLDVSTIFGNALDNAIEACEKLPQEERFISIRGGIEGSYLTIQIENSACQADYSQNISTTKTDTFLHGFGKKNIRKTVEKYTGNSVWEYKDGIYSISILIPISEVE